MDSRRSPAKHGALRAALGLGLGLGLGWLALGGCSSPRARPVPTLNPEITEQNRHLEQQFRAGNLLGVADVYADDAVLVDERGERTAGREAIDAFWSAIESPVDWKLEIRSIRGSESVAYELGISRLSTRRDGALTTTATDFLLLWRREPGGDWRIALHAFWPREKG